MFKQAFLLSLLIHNAFPDCQCGLRTEFERALIYGGKDAQPGEYPWQAFIMAYEDHTMQDYYNCGGSIINTEWILTAAHCLPNASELNNQAVQPDILVRVGRVDNTDLDSVLRPWINYRLNNGPRPEMSTLNENGLFLVDRWVSHSDYPNFYSADIGLLHVQTPFTFSATTRAVCLETPSAEQKFYPDIEISGWGSTSDNITNDTDRLQAVQVRQIDDESCARSPHFDPERGMCFNSGSPGGCEGDSGSPYVVKKSGRFHQIAVMSAGFNPVHNSTCSENSGERIGIRVAYFYEWIKQAAITGTWCSPN